MPYNPKIHHRRSIRLKGYDYSKEGLYFITICTHDRQCVFGSIRKDIMILNDAGNIANKCWLQIPGHFPNAILHEHIIMPNHVHGIIELIRNDIVPDVVGSQNFVTLQQHRTGNTIGVENFQSPPSKHNQFQKIIPRSIGSIIRGYKIGVTKWFRANTDIKTVWQRNYYEHIIRTQRSYQAISRYIINNPAKWNGDNFFY